MNNLEVFMKNEKLFKKQSTDSIELTNPLIQMIDFNLRILRDLDGLSLYAKVKMYKIAFENICDILSMKVSKKSDTVSRFICEYLEEVAFPEIAKGKELVDFIKEKYDPGFTEDLLPSIYIRPHTEGCRTYIITSRKPHNWKSLYETIKPGNDVVIMHQPVIAKLVTEIKDFVIDGDRGLLNENIFMKGDTDERKYVELNSIMDEVSEKNVYFQTPYYSYEHVYDFVNEVCNNKDIHTVYMTMYRTLRDSSFIRALKRAADSGKEVNVFIEPNARGNEDENGYIYYELSRYSPKIKVIYGSKYKVHCKMFIGVGVKKSYAHFSTGNYINNGYVDSHFMTSDPEMVEAAVRLYSNIMLWAVNKDDVTRDLINNYSDRLLYSPVDLKSKIIGMILEETSKEKRGHIFIKCNTLLDSEIIYYLHKAAMAKVNIEICVRTATLFFDRDLITGEKYDNVLIYSKAGRRLEHERIYQFGSKTYISSADLSFRNMHKRVETLVGLDGFNIPFSTKFSTPWEAIDNMTDFGRIDVFNGVSDEKGINWDYIPIESLQ